MDNLKVLCDDCLVSRGIVATPMAGPVKMGARGPLMQMDLGDTYSCSGCGRRYSVKLGYFTFVSGEPPQRNRFHPRRSNSNGNMEPMYIRRSAKDGCAVFGCPGLQRRA
jgi:hypothetical protein